MIPTTGLKLGLNKINKTLGKSNLYGCLEKVPFISSKINIAINWLTTQINKTTNEQLLEEFNNRPELVAMREKVKDETTVPVMFYIDVTTSLRALDNPNWFKELNLYTFHTIRIYDKEKRHCVRVPGNSGYIKLERSWYFYIRELLEVLVGYTPF